MVLAVTTVWPDPPHPVAPPIKAIESATRSSPPSRRRRGEINRNREAIVTPEPAAYHVAAEPDVRPCRASIVPGPEFPGALGICRLAIMPERVTVVVGEDVDDVIVTEAGLKLMPGV